MCSHTQSMSLKEKALQSPLPERIGVNAAMEKVTLFLEQAINQSSIIVWPLARTPQHTDNDPCWHNYKTVKVQKHKPRPPFRTPIQPLPCPPPFGPLPWKQMEDKLKFSQLS